MGDEQYPKSVFPNQIDRSGDSLYTAPDATPTFTPEGVLQLSIGARDLVLRVDGIDLNRVPSRGLVTIGEEQVRYSGVNVDLKELYVPNEDLRGFGGTSASGHLAGSRVCWLMTNQHLASVHAAIEATQEHIGVRGSTDPASIEFRITHLQEDIDNGFLKREPVTLDGDMAAAKSVTLSSGAKSPNNVLMFVVGGGVMDNGTDFVVSETTPAVVGWAGLALDGLLAADDKLLFVYEQKD